MANNSFIFDGALTGATGGIHERWLTDTDSTSYLQIRNLLVAFANAVDALIPTDPSINPADEALIQSICAGVLSQRYLTPTTNVGPIAQAIVALYQTVKTQLIPVPYPVIDPLASIRYVDQGTITPIAEQNGSILRPFSTLTQAIASIPGGGVVLTAPGDYSAEPALNLGANAFSIVGIDPHCNYVFQTTLINGIILPAITGTGGLNLVSARCNGTITSFAMLRASSCIFAAPVTVTNFDGFDNRFLAASSPLTINGAISLTDCELDAITISNALTIVRLIDCVLVTSSAVTFTGPPGSLIVDSRSAFFVINLPTVLTNGTRSIEALVGDPAMAANSVRGNPTAIVGAEQSIAVGVNTVVGRRGANLVAAQIVPNQLAPEASSIAVPFIIRSAFAAGGGGAPDDVIIFNANSPFNFLLLDCIAIIGTGVALATIQIRSATGGGGAALSSALPATLPGTSRNNNTTVPVVLAGSTMVVRRSDSGIAGTVVITGSP